MSGSLRPDEPCGHPGCLSHVTHPCEGCGRIAGRYPAPAYENCACDGVGMCGEHITDMLGQFPPIPERLTDRHADAIEYAVMVLDKVAPRTGGANLRGRARDAARIIRENCRPALSTGHTPSADETDPYFVLDFCEGAIRDAITLEDGLDGATGESVLAMIRNARAARSRSPLSSRRTTP